MDKYNIEKLKAIRQVRPNNAKLSIRDIPFIRHFLNLGFKIKDVALAFNVHLGTIENIKYGRSWKLIY